MKRSTASGSGALLLWLIGVPVWLFAAEIATGLLVAPFVAKGLTAGLIEPSAAPQIDCAARLEHGLVPKRRRNAVVVTLHDELMVVVNACLVAVGPISLLMLAGAWSPVYRQSWSRLACWWSCLALLLIACAGVTGAILG